MEPLCFLFHDHRVHGYLCADAQTFLVKKRENLYPERPFKFRCSIFRKNSRNINEHGYFKAATRGAIFHVFLSSHFW